MLISLYTSTISIQWSLPLLLSLVPSIIRLDQSLSVAHLPKIVTVLMNCLLAKRKDTVKLTTQILKVSIKLYIFTHRTIETSIFFMCCVL